jgi:hypothetical protein
MFVDLALQQVLFAKYHLPGSQAVCLPTWDDRVLFACYVMLLSGTIFVCRCLNLIKCVPMREGPKVAVLEEAVVEPQLCQTIATTDPTTTLREMCVIGAINQDITRIIARRTAIDNRSRGSSLSESLLDALLVSLLRR